MGDCVSKVYNSENKQILNKKEIENDILKEEQNVKIIEGRTILIESNENSYLCIIKYLNYIDIIKSLICLFNEKIVFFKYPSFERNFEYENIINTNYIFYCNYQKDSNKLYLGRDDFTNVYLIQNKSIKQLEEIIPLGIIDLIEISLIKIIVLDREKNIAVCFELKNKKYLKKKIIFGKKGIFYSIRKCPNADKFFLLNNLNIQIFDSKTLELISVLSIENNDICFLNKNHFITVNSHSRISFLRLIDLKTIKILDNCYKLTQMDFLQTIGNKRYFIAAESTNVSNLILMESNNNKINIVRRFKKYMPFYRSLYFDNTLFCGGDNKIHTFKFDIK